MEICELLRDAYDLHVHTGPDVMPRKLDDLEMAERLQKVGMKGYAIKSHYFCSAERARLVNKLFPGLNVIGSISLNSAVGGLNPMTVEMAARDGARIVWMPTFDSLNEQEHILAQPPEKRPHWARLKLELLGRGWEKEGLSILENGKLKPAVTNILDIVAQYNIVLATGHLDKQEIFSLVKAAKLHKVKLVVTHPDFPTINLSKEEQKELSSLGAYMEYCFTTPHTGKTTWQAVYQAIKLVGAEKCILSTDLGQPSGLYPDEGLKLFVTNLLSNNFSAAEVRKMVVENPALLVEN